MIKFVTGYLLDAKVDALVNTDSRLAACIPSVHPGTMPLR